MGTLGQATAAGTKRRTFRLGRPRVGQSGAWPALVLGGTGYMVVNCLTTCLTYSVAL